MIKTHLFGHIFDDQSIVGLSESDAAKVIADKGFSYVVCNIDNKYQEMKTNYVEKRLNLFLLDGKVTKAKFDIG